MVKKENSSDSQNVLDAFLEHRSVLAGYLARKLLRADEIEDLLQDTFIQAYRASEKTTLQSPKGYLFIIARNLLSKKFAKQAKEMRTEISDAAFDFIESSEVPADQQLHYKLKLSALEEAMKSLPPQCRRVFTMRKIQGLSQKQIASKLSISTSTVERHITIAITRLNSLMVAQGYNQSLSDIERDNSDKVKDFK